MYRLSQQGWSSTVELVHSGLKAVSLQSPNYNVIIYTNDITPSTELTTGLVVRALYEMVVCMAKQQPGFYQARSFMTLQGRAIGGSSITRMVDIPSPISKDDEFLYNTSRTPILDQNGKRSGNASLAVGGSGEIPDPEDSRFKISYQYDGKNIASLDILSAVLDGLATVAQYNEDGPCPYITAVSFSGNTAIHIGPVPGEALFGWHVSRTLYLLIFRLFLVQGIFREMNFSLFYYGTMTAKGYIMKMRSVGGDGRVGLTVSE